ncbi:heme NO-binding domain-containing protein [Granulicella paludicola]|uniref:heme NO-binding domain-containing protein n=1 Tax=Granulicella paludicola TaxID=474951 RepID=UPI0021E0390E|nr:heme NO-binding domain-containing protein [Granulicella paludicola]
MKGTIVKCMQDLVTRDFGKDKWQASLTAAGLNGTVITVQSDVPDTDVHKLIKGIADVNGLKVDQVIEAFGDYWSSVYAPSIYSVYFDKAKSAKELLTNLGNIHTVVTKSVPNAAPPAFTYEWESDKVLIMNYSSSRGMVQFMPALVRGVGKYYKEKINVSLSGNKVRVQFA